jgi:outer membrane protein assembly factor BamB
MRTQAHTSGERRRQAFRAIVLSVLLATSLVAMPFAGAGVATADAEPSAAADLNTDAAQALTTQPTEESDPTDSLDESTVESLNLDMSTAQSSGGENGTVYIGSYDANLYALDAATGDKEWSYTTGNAIFSSPTVANGTVYVGSHDDNLYALDAATGDKEWNYSAWYYVKSSPTVANGTVYVGSDDDGLYAINATTGDKEWNYSTGGNVPSSPTVANGTVYVGSINDSLYAIDAATGDKEWNYPTESYVESSPTVANGVVYVGSEDGNLYAIDAVTGNKEWKYSTGDGVESSPTVANGTVYVGSDDNNLYAIDATTGDKEWNYSTGRKIDSSPTVANGAVYVGSDDNNLYAIDAVKGNKEWKYSMGDGTYSSPTVANGTVYIGSDNGNLYAIDTVTGDEEWNHSTVDNIMSSPTYVPPDSDTSDGTRVNLGTLGHVGDITAAGGEPISGQVVTQNGVPIENATVTVSGLTGEAINESQVEDVEQAIEDKEEELQDPSPKEWNNAFDPEPDLFDNTNAEYVAAHTKDEWDLSGMKIGGRVFTSEFDPTLGNPDTKVPANEQIVFSVWDGSKTGFINAEDNVDASLPGKTTSGTVVVEQLSPSNEVIDRTTKETEDTARVFGLTANQGSKTHETAALTLSPGFYRIYPESNPAASYVVVAGDITALKNNYKRELLDQKGDLTQRSQNLRRMREDQEFYVETIQTNANGEFSTTVPSNAETATIRAYKADGVALKDVQEPSMQDLIDLRASGYDGSFYIPTNDKSNYDVPAEDVELVLHKKDVLPMSPTARLNTLLDKWQNEFLDQPLANVRSRFTNPFTEINRSTLDDMYVDRCRIINGSGVVEAEEVFNESGACGTELPDSDDTTDDVDLSDDEIRDRLDDIEEELDNQNPVDPVYPDDPNDVTDPTDPVDPTDPSYPDEPTSPTDPTEPVDPWINIEDGLLEAEYPVPNGVDPGNILLDLHTSDGGTTTVDESYWSVESSGTFQSGQKIVVEDYPVDETDPAVLSLNVRVLTDNGIIDDRMNIINPAFSGEVPAVNVDLSTTSPGPDERVSVSLRPRDRGSFGELERVSVFDPDGNELNATLRSGTTAAFDTDGAGVHHVRATYSTPTGDQFVQAFKIRAGETSRTDPATIRAESSPMGLFAIAGNGLADADIQSDGSSLNVVGEVAGTEDVPGKVHVRPGAALSGTDHELDLSIVHGADQTEIRSNVLVYVHLDNHPENALHYRNGEPITWDGETRFGEVMDRGGDNSDKAVLVTYTDSSGDVSLSVNQDPGPLDRASHWTSVQINSIDGWLPSLPGFLSPLPLGAGEGATVGGVLGLGLVARRQRS